MLGNDSKIYNCHIDRYSADYTTVSGVAKSSLSDKSVLGLGNLSNVTWKVTAKDGQSTDIPPNQYVKLAAGMKIDFGGTLGEIF